MEQEEVGLQAPCTLGSTLIIPLEALGKQAQMSVLGPLLGKNASIQAHVLNPAKL